MKILLLIILLILIFALCYIMYSETKTFCEGLQNFDASYLYHGSEEYEDTDPVPDPDTFFYNKIMNENDVDLSNILTDPDYNASYFIDESGGEIYNLSSIEKDVKYFNNVSHILSDYYAKNMILNDN